MESILLPCIECKVKAQIMKNRREFVRAHLILQGHIVNGIYMLYVHVIMLKCITGLIVLLFVSIAMLLYFETGIPGKITCVALLMCLLKLFWHPLRALSLTLHTNRDIRR